GLLEQRGSQVELPVAIAEIARAPEPLLGFFAIGHRSGAALVEQPEPVLRLRVSLRRGLPRPTERFGVVFLHSLALGITLAQLRLCPSIAGFRRLAQPLRGLRGVGRTE